MSVKRVLSVLLLALFATIAPLHAETTEPETEELWYAIRMMDQPVGWMVAREIQEGDQIRTQTEVEITIKRGPIPIQIHVETGFLETVAGDPIQATLVQRLGQMSMEQEVTFHDDHLQLVSRQNGQEIERSLPRPIGDWMSPAAAGRYTVERLEAGDESFSVRTFDPSTSLTQPIQMTLTVLDRTTVEVLGKEVPAIETKAILSMLPTMPMTMFIDEQGRPLKMTMSLGGIAYEMLQSSESLARAKVNPPELMAKLFIPVDEPIPSARTLEEASYLLTISEGEMPELPQTGSQRVEKVGPQQARLTIQTNAPAQTSTEAPSIKRSAFLDGQDEKVAALARQATEGVSDDPAKRAEAMRRFVLDYIDKKNLNVGFATASEVARTATGDCSEHGVLLAAMLRADGIPSRVATGVVYVDEFLDMKQIFGYHMWTQAWLNGRWVDLDATLPSSFSATHITLAVSDMENEGMLDLMDMVPLMGRLSIKYEPSTTME